MARAWRRTPAFRVYHDDVRAHPVPLVAVQAKVESVDCLLIVSTGYDRIALVPGFLRILQRMRGATSPIERLASVKVGPDSWQDLQVDALEWPSAFATHGVLGMNWFLPAYDTVGVAVGREMNGEAAALLYEWDE